MSVQLVRLEWSSVDDTTTQVLSLSPITDIVGLTAKKGIDIKNNIMNVELKNAFSKYVDDDGLIRFKENDILKLYIERTSDGDDLSGTWWGDDSLVGIYYLQEYEHILSSDKARIKLTCVDKAYILFNKVFTKTYGVQANDYWTSPGIFRSVTRINSHNEQGAYMGSDNDSGSTFDLNALFVSEGGYITDYRDDPTTALNGSINNSVTTITVDSTTGFKTSGTLVIGSEHIYYTGTTSTTFTGCVRGIDDTTAESHSDNVDVYQGFPIVDLTKIWKPIYEWLTDIGQTQMTNYSDETIEGGTLNYNRAFVLWIDKNNEMHWIPADNTVDTDIVIGTDAVYELSLEKSVFDSVNMVIYNVGEDMYGAGAIWYYFNENTDVSTLKMRYQPMTELIETILNKEYEINSGSYPAAVVGDNNRRFPSSYPHVPSFLTEANSWKVQVLGESAATNASSNSTYNDLLRYAALWRGRNEAIAITQRLSGLRYRGTVTRQGLHVNPGDIITITDTRTGLLSQKVRVLDITQTLGVGQWSTTLDVEEDEKVITI